MKSQEIREMLLQLFQNMLENLETTITRIEVTLLLEKEDEEGD